MNFEKVSIGADIEDIDRFTKLDIKRDKAFFDKIYTKKEIEYCFSKANPAEHLAARFAGKEAVIKALTSMIDLKLNLCEIEILNNKKKEPKINLNASGLKNFRIKISLSHCSDKAIAFVMVFGGNNHEKN